MARVPQRPVFLERNSYRQRRLRDVARVMPVLGIVLWLLPLAWRGTETGTAATLTYIFAVWLVLIALSAVVSTKILPGGDKGQADQETR